MLVSPRRLMVLVPWAELWIRTTIAGAIAVIYGWHNWVNQK